MSGEEWRGRLAEHEAWFRHARRREWERRIGPPSLPRSHLGGDPATAQYGGEPTIARRNGWGVPTGTAQREAFATDSVTLVNLARAVKALIDDLWAYGILGGSDAPTAMATGTAYDATVTVT